MKPLQQYVFLFAFVFASPALQGVTVKIGGTGQPFEFISMESAELVGKSLKSKTLQMKKIFSLSQDSQKNSIHASFEDSVFSTPSLSNLVIKQNFISRNGGGSGNFASFENSNHHLQIRLPSYLFTSSADTAGDFTIAFMIKPYMRGRKMPVLRRLSYFDGNKFGIEVYAENDRIHFDFTRVFTGEKFRFVSISSRDTLSTTEFTPVSLAFNSAKGHLTLYMNHREQKRIFLSKGNTFSQANFLPYDRSPLVIGDGFTGGIDELIFSNMVMDTSMYRADYGKVESRGDRFFQQVAKATSGIVDLQFSHSLVWGLSLQTTIPDQTKAELLVRYSDRKFNPALSEESFPFRSVSHKTSFYARYFQYQIRMYSDTTGLNSPKVQALQYSVRQDGPPSAPRSVEIVSARPGEVILRFMRNAEMDVIHGGRYQIYYGVKPNEPLGVIRYKAIQSTDGFSQYTTINDKNDRFTTKDPRLQNRIQVVITNEMIIQNLVFFRDRPMYKMPYPLIRENVNYYFWVTACDSAFDLVPERDDHESPPSKAVSARPDFAFQNTQNNTFK